MLFSLFLGFTLVLFVTLAISFFRISFLMMSLVAFFVLENEKALLFEGECDCKDV